jgi:hypothetical protein
MMSKRTIFLLAGLLILGVLAWFATVKRNANTSVDELDVMFAVRDTSSINKIFVADKDGSRYLLDRTSRTTWTINKNIVASPILVNALLEVVRDVDMKRPCTAAERTEVVKHLAAEHKKVEIYANNELVRSYYVGGSTVDHLGTYFMLTDGQNPYVCHIPGFEGYLDVRYDVDTVGWKSPKIFFGTSKSIKAVTLNSGGQKALQLSRSGNDWAAEGVAVLDQQKLYTYLDNFNRVYVGEWKPTKGLAVADSLNQKPAQATVQIEDENPKLNRLIKLYANQETEHYWQVVVMPQGSIGMVSKDLFSPFLVRADKLAAKAK